jgi:hypothetical protein
MISHLQFFNHENVRLLKVTLSRCQSIRWDSRISYQIAAFATRFLLPVTISSSSMLRHPKGIAADKVSKYLEGVRLGSIYGHLILICRDIAF